jgi:hypothetical protein
MWLLDFGDSQAEAERALDIIKHYRMNGQCFVGRPDPSMEYFLVDGQPPRGHFPGEDCVSFDSDNIEVVSVSGNWKIIEGSQILLDFGNSEEEANDAYRIIKLYKFDNMCFVGRPGPSMEYLIVHEIYLVYVSTILCFCLLRKGWPNSS